MRYIPLALVAALILPLVAACSPGGVSGASTASDPSFTEPTFVSVQPVAYPHPTGCDMCGFPSRLGTPEQ